MSEPSVSEWIDALERGERGSAVDNLWNRYFERVANLVRRRLKGLRTHEDEEDVALSVMKSFFLRAEEGKFNSLSNRLVLWKILVVVAERKTADLQRRALAEKRDVDRQQSIDRLPTEPTSRTADSVAEEVRSLLAEMPDDTARVVIRMHLSGYKNREIGTQIGRSESTVERKLRLARTFLKEQIGQNR